MAFADPGLKFLFPRCKAVGTCQTVQRHKADIMAVFGIFTAGVTKAYENLHHGLPLGERSYRRILNLQFFQAMSVPPSTCNKKRGLKKAPLSILILRSNLFFVGTFFFFGFFIVDAGRFQA